MRDFHEHVSKYELLQCYSGPHERQRISLRLKLNQGFKTIFTLTLLFGILSSIARNHDTFYLMKETYYQVFAICKLAQIRF